MNDRNLRSYQELHKPKGNFATRAEYLEHELEIMAPKRWGVNLPFRDYRFEYEDWVPAMAATIGKIVMVAAVVAAFAGPMGLSNEFVIENARYEMLIAALLFVVLFSGFLNPTANLAGTHGPLIPLIPLIVASGGHPMALGIMVGVLGFTLGVFKGGSLLARLTSDGVCGGLLLYLGFIGITSQIKKLFGWADGFDMGYIAFVVVFATIVMYAYLEHIRMRWLAIPLGSALAALIAFVMGAPFEFTTEPGVPNLNPMYWWGEDTGWQIGLPDLHHFIAVAPFAVLAVAMWSPDFLGHRVFQQLNYPPKAKKVLMNIDDTMCVAAARQIVGTSLGGAIWRRPGVPSWSRRPSPSVRSRRCAAHRPALCGRRALGLSDGPGHLAAGTERGADGRRVPAAAGSRHADDPRGQDLAVGSHRDFLFGAGQSGVRLVTHRAAGQPRTDR